MINFHLCYKPEVITCNTLPRVAFQVINVAPEDYMNPDEQLVVLDENESLISLPWELFLEFFSEDVTGTVNSILVLLIRMVIWCNSSSNYLYMK